ncbi:unnamed protein product [Rhizophagus irregularis]|nr:unnamed protein product [Rhizophagus irregularis]
MKKCWDSDPSKRPSITEIKEAADDCSSSATSGQVYDSEECKFDIDSSTRSKLVPGISKSLKSSFTNSSFISTLNTDHGYTSTDLYFDIEMNSQKPMLSISSTTQNNLNTQHPDAIYSSRPLSTLISNIKNNSELNNKN